MRNVYRQFKELFPDAPLQIGTVEYVSDGVAHVILLGGGRVKALGDASPGDSVYLRDGAILSVTNDIPTEVIWV